MAEPQPAANMLAAALYYARLGYAVFPVHSVLDDGRCTCALTEHPICKPDDPKASIGKHPRIGRWQVQASHDPDTIRAWWQRWPDANIGVATGVPSESLAVDIDGAAGNEKLVELEAQHGPLPKGPISTTGRGRHLWFRDPVDEMGAPRLRNSAKKLPEIDIRATGGFVVVPPSKHKSGVRYAWVEGLSVREIEPPTMPEWLIGHFLAQRPSPAASHGDAMLDAFQRTVERSPAPTSTTNDNARLRGWMQHALDAEFRELASLGEGSRGSSLNKSAYKLAGYLSSGAVDERAIERLLVDASTANGLVAKDGAASVLATIRRGIASGRQHPRGVPYFDPTPTHTRSHPAPPQALRPPHPLDPAAGHFDGDEPPPGDDDFGGGGGGGAELPQIFDEDNMARLADRYLSSDPELYQRSGQLVHVIEEPKPSEDVLREQRAPTIRVVPQSWLRVVSTRCVRWMKKRLTKDGEWVEDRIKPPKHAIAALAERGRWQHMRLLEGVATSPLFRPNGEILSTPGYDKPTCVLFVPAEKFPPIPDRPTRMDVEGAVEQLRYVVQDFPFETPAHEAAWFAAVLTPLARYAFKGPSPLIVVDATTFGTGKGKLANVTGIISTGRTPTYSTLAGDEAEQRKRISSLVMAGEMLVNFDNLEGKFGNALLAGMLTVNEWSDRILGSKDSYRGVILTTWMATGNNVQFSGDLVRRVLQIRLVANVERPDLRKDFKITNVEAYAHEHRARLACAALTILRGWHVAGRPRADVPPFGSFDGWDAVVRPAVIWAGLKDPGETRDQLRDLADSATDELQKLIDGFVEVMPHSRLPAGEILVKARDDSGAALREALEQFSGGRPLTSKGIAKTLSRFRGRIIDGRMITSVKDPSRKQQVWWVERAPGSTTEEAPPSF